MLRLKIHKLTASAANACGFLLAPNRKRLAPSSEAHSKLVSEAFPMLDSGKPEIPILSHCPKCWLYSESGIRLPETRLSYGRFEWTSTFHRIIQPAGPGSGLVAMPAMQETGRPQLKPSAAHRPRQRTPRGRVASPQTAWIESSE
jgi:hypothetical protein